MPSSTHKQETKIDSYKYITLIINVLNALVENKKSKALLFWDFLKPEFRKFKCIIQIIKTKQLNLY